MKINSISKRCERCEKMFEIPNIKESPARQTLIEFTPCPHCLYVKDVKYPKNNRTGRCLGCSIPFALVDHHAIGRCSRCYMGYIRNKNKEVC